MAVSFDTNVFIFLLYTISLALIILWYLMYSSRHVGWFISKLVSLWLNEGEEIDIGAVGIAPLGGKIFAHRVMYKNKDVAILILKCTTNIQWWLTDVRSRTSVESGLQPFRLTIVLEGVEVYAYNNNEAEHSDIKRLVIDNLGEEQITQELNKRVPWILTFFPALKLQAEYFNVYIGAPHLEKCLVVSLKQLDLVWYYDLPTHFDDLYQHRFKSVIRDCQAFLINTVDKSTVIEPFVFSNWAKETFFMVLSLIKQNFSESSKDAFNSIFRSKNVFLRRQNDTDLHNRFILLQNQHSSSYEALTMFHNVDYSSSYAPIKKLFSNFDEIAIPNLSNQIFKDKSSERDNEVLFFSQAHVDLSIDVAGYYSSENVLRIEGPKQDLSVTFDSALSIKYNPKFEKFKSSFIEHFFPANLKHSCVHKNIIGATRDCILQKMSILFLDKSTIRLCFESPLAAQRHLHNCDFVESTDNDEYLIPDSLLEDCGHHILTLKRLPAYVDLTIGRGSSFIISKPLLFKDETEKIIYATSQLHDFNITPSFTKIELLTSSFINLSASILQPIKWNDVHKVTLSCDVDSSQIFFLQDHAVFFGELSSFWSSFREKQELKYFIPTVFDLKFKFDKSLMYFHANENNLIDFPNSLTDNVMLLIETRTAEFSINFSDVDYSPFLNEIDILGNLQNTTGSFIFPQGLEMYKSSGSFFAMKSLTISQSLAFHPNFSPTYRDSIDATITAFEPELKLTGHTLRYLIATSENYGSRYSSFISSASFTLLGFRNTFKSECHEIWDFIKNSDVNEPRKSNINSKDVSVQLLVQHLTVRLPRNINSEAKSSKIFIFELNVDFRDISQYIDVHLTSSPITFTAPIGDTSDQNFVTEFYHGVVPHIRIEDFTLQAHFFRGINTSTIYKVRCNSFVSSIIGMLLPSQLNFLAMSIKSIFHQFSDSGDSRLWIRGLLSAMENKNSELDLFSINDLFDEVILGNQIPKASENHNQSTLCLQRSRWTRYIIETINILQKNSSFVRLRPSSSKDYSEFSLFDIAAEFCLGKFEFSLLHPASVIRLQLNSGAQASLSTIISSLGSKRTAISIPRINIDLLAPIELTRRYFKQNVASDQIKIDESVSLFGLDGGILFIHALHRSDWEFAKKHQSDFLSDATQGSFTGISEEENYRAWFENNANQTNIPMQDENSNVDSKVFNFNTSNLNFTASSLNKEDDSLSNCSFYSAHSEDRLIDPNEENKFPLNFSRTNCLSERLISSQSCYRSNISINQINDNSLNPSISIYIPPPYIEFIRSDEQLFNSNYKNLWHSCSSSVPNFVTDFEKNDSDVELADHVFGRRSSFFKFNKLPVFCHKFHLESTSNLEISISPLTSNFLDGIFELFACKSASFDDILDDIHSACSHFTNATIENEFHADKSDLNFGINSILSSVAEDAIINNHYSMANSDFQVVFICESLKVLLLNQFEDLESNEVKVVETMFSLNNSTLLFRKSFCNGEDNKVTSYNYISHFSCGKSNVYSFLDLGDTIPTCMNNSEFSQSLLFSIEASGCEIDYLKEVILNNDPNSNTLNKRDSTVSLIVDKLSSRSRFQFSEINFNCIPIAPYFIYSNLLEWNNVFTEIFVLTHIFKTIKNNKFHYLCTELISHACSSQFNLIGNDTVYKQFLAWSFMRQGLSKDDNWSIILKDSLDAKGTEVFLFSDFVSLLAAASSPVRPFIFMIHRLNNILPSIQRQRISRKFSIFDRNDIIKAELVQLSSIIDIQRLRTSKDQIFKLAIEEFLVDSQILLTAPELKPKMTEHCINWKLTEVNACSIESNRNMPISKHKFSLKNCAGSCEFISNSENSSAVKIGSATTLGRTGLIELDIGAGVCRLYEYFLKMKSCDSQRLVNLLINETLKKSAPLASPVGKITYSNHLADSKKDSTINTREAIFKSSLLFLEVSKKFRNDNSSLVDSAIGFLELYTQTIIDKVVIRLRSSDILDSNNFALAKLEFRNLQCSFSKNIFLNYMTSFSNDQFEFIRSESCKFFLYQHNNKFTIADPNDSNTMVEVNFNNFCLNHFHQNTIHSLVSSTLGCSIKMSIWSYNFDIINNFLNSWTSQLFLNSEFPANTLNISKEGGLWTYLSSILSKTALSAVFENISLIVVPSPNISLSYNLNRLIFNLSHLNADRITFDFIIGEFDQNLSGLNEKSQNITFNAITNRPSTGVLNSSATNKDNLRISFTEKIPASRFSILWSKSYNSFDAVELKFTVLKIQCCIESVVRELNIDIAENYLQLLYILGPELSKIVQDTLDMIRNLSYKWSGNQNSTSSSFAIMDNFSSIVSKTDSWPIRLVNFSVLFEGVQIGVSSTNTDSSEYNDVKMRIFSGHSKLNFSFYPSIEPISIINDPNSPYHSQPLCFPNSTDRIFNEGSNSFYQPDYLKSFFSYGISTFLFLTLHLDNMYLMISPLRKNLHNNDASLGVFLKIASNLQFDIATRVPVIVGSNSINNRSNTLDFLNDQHVTKHNHKIRFSLYMDSSTISLEPGILIIAISQIKYYQDYFDYLNKQFIILRQKKIITHEPFDKFLNSFDFIGKINAFQMDIVKRSQTFLIEYRIVLSKTYGEFLAKSSVSVCENNSLTYTFLAFKIDRIEFDASHTPYILTHELDIDIKDLRKVFNQAQLIKSDSSLANQVNDTDSLIQSINFSCRISLLQAGLFGNKAKEYNFFSDVEGISEYFLYPNNQNHSNFILIPIIMSNGSGAIHSTVLKMDAFASSSGPLLSMNADSIRYFLELYESIENMVFTIFLLYPPELAPVSEKNLNNVSSTHASIDILDNPLLLKRLELNIVTFFQPGECLIFSSFFISSHDTNAFDQLCLRLLSRVSFPSVRFSYNGKLPTLVPLRSLSQELLIRLPTSLINSIPEHILIFEVHSSTLSLEPDILVFFAEIQEVVIRHSNDYDSAQEILQGMVNNLYLDADSPDFMISKYMFPSSQMVVLFSLMFRNHISKRSVASSTEIHLEQGNICVTASILPSRIVLSCSPIDSNSFFVLENFSPFYIFFTSALINDEHFNNIHSIRLYSTTLSGMDCSISLFNNDDNGSFLEFSMAYGGLNVSAVVGLLQKLNFRHHLVHLEDCNFKIFFSKLKSWTAFEMAWLSRSWYYNTKMSANLTLSSKRVKLLDSNFDLFTICRFEESAMNLNMNEVENITCDGPIRIRLIDIISSSVRKQLKFLNSTSSRESCFPNADNILKFEAEFYEIDSNLKSIKDGFNGSLFCAHCLFDFERIPIGEEGKQYQLWNREEKYFRNFLIVNADPIDLSCQTSRIPYLFNFSSEGVSEIYMEDMINPEHSCWEVNFDFRHEKGSISLSLCADTILYFNIALKNIWDIVTISRQKSLTIMQSSPSELSLLENNNDSNSFSFKIKDYANSDIAKQKEISAAITVGSVDFLTNSFIMKLHGDGQDKSFINFEFANMHAGLVSVIGSFVDPIKFEREFILNLASQNKSMNALVINYHTQEMVVENFCQIPGVFIASKSNLDLRNLNLTSIFDTKWEGLVGMSSNVYVYKNIKRIFDLHSRKSAVQSSTSNLRLNTAAKASAAAKTSNLTVVRISEALKLRMPWLCYYDKKVDHSANELVSSSNNLIKLNIDPNSKSDFIFRPNIAAVGDFTPTTEWILSQLELKPIVLPEIIHSRVVSIMESFLNLSGKLSAHTDEVLD